MERRRADEHERLKQFRRLARRQNTDHRAEGITDENAVSHFRRAADLDDRYP
jgi:hypothetical protein